MARQRNPAPELPLRIRRGRYELLILYEVSETELELLVRGPTEAIYLNFAIFLLSTALSFIIALLTAVVSDRAFIVFVLVAVVGVVSGIVLLALWLRSCRSTVKLLETIKRRLPTEDIQEPPAQTPSGS